MKRKKNKGHLLFVVQFSVDKLHTIVKEQQIIERSFVAENAPRSLSDIPIGTRVHVKDGEEIYEALIMDVDFEDERPRLVEACSSMIRAAHSHERPQNETTPSNGNNRPKRIIQKTFRYDEVDSGSELNEQESKQEAEANVAAVRKAELQMKKSSEKKKLKELQALHVQKGRELGQLLMLRKAKEKSGSNNETTLPCTSINIKNLKRTSNKVDKISNSSPKKFKTAASNDCSVVEERVDDSMKDVTVQKNKPPDNKNMKSYIRDPLLNNPRSVQMMFESSDGNHSIANKSSASSSLSHECETCNEKDQSIINLKQEIVVLNNEKKILLDERDIAYLENRKVHRQYSELQIKFDAFKDTISKSDALSIPLLESVLQTLKHRTTETDVEEQLQELEKFLQNEDIERTDNGASSNNTPCYSSVLPVRVDAVPEPTSALFSFATSSSADASNLILSSGGVTGVDSAVVPQPSNNESLSDEQQIDFFDWAYDEESQLLHPHLQDGVCLLHEEHPTILVNSVLRERAKRRSTSMSDCIRTLAPGIFKAEALKVCSCKGSDRGRRGKDPIRRPGLNSTAVQAICKFTMEVGVTKRFKNNSEAYFYKQVNKFLQDKH